MKHLLHSEMLRALIAAFDDLQQIRTGIDGLDGDTAEVTRITSILDARVYALRVLLQREGVRQP